MRELMNFVNYIEGANICLVTKIKNRATGGENFNFHDKTNCLPSHDVHDIHIFTGGKCPILAVFELFLRFFALNHSFLSEYYEYRLTTLRARRIFVPIYIGGLNREKRRCVNLCEYSVFEVHKIQLLNIGG